MVDDEELEKLREQRKEELSEVDRVDQEEQLEQQRQEIKNLAAQYLTKEARSRLGNVRAADPELASAVEMQVAQLGRMGQIDELGDGELKQILKEVQQSGEDTDIKFRR